MPRELETIEDMYINCIYRVFGGNKIDAVTDPSSITYGKASRERIGLSYKIENPLSRIILNPARKFNILQVMGHFLWIMKGDNILKNVSYYNPKASALSDDGITHRAAYGERLMFCSNGNGGIKIDQLKNVITRLKMDLQSRRAFATIYNPVIDSCCMQTNDFPCTIGYQFLIRNNKLDMICFMRSQSVLFVMPYDVFINTMLQEYMAKRLGVEIGNYYHTGGSFHFFENETKFAEKIIEADYIIPENFSMPKMYDNVLDGLNHVLEHETLIRESAVAGSYIHLPDDHADEYGKYWGDIIRLLEIYAIDKIEKDISEHIRKTYERKVLIKKLHPTYQAALEILE